MEFRVDIKYLDHMLHLCHTLDDKIRHNVANGIADAGESIELDGQLYDRRSLDLMKEWAEHYEVPFVEGDAAEDGYLPKTKFLSMSFAQFCELVPNASANDSESEAAWKYLTSMAEHSFFCKTVITAHHRLYDNPRVTEA